MSGRRRLLTISITSEVEAMIEKAGSEFRRETGTTISDARISGAIMAAAIVSKELIDEAMASLRKELGIREGGRR